ncbi:MAG: 23S rRNA (pseudouridine(1915)-N(3))-methyltransferase RlmH [Rhizobiales bacterium]|nr:23S rRNA (pseudouridine(1915)-N(3))-methyltransferase RlmH [Hyphomicrobiales bacterium]MBO6699670.1 23S rRNA (pseudouridine(1915)-N(3))-methyltransferase RlmH [Hyphomicrobiales bacterium]MBO6737208.1 23S rRNA (pseudouridine(1915)-N(3))-methyltransferase RlmH [Hyphomicrobiales bacterium]MBO6911718.1 23S rRNA (pseudouridine(1915)-N(3))-methyltransferase RlmH [Hyphomicrobiales bacterium]MBO6954860.1 23S rRNA (pseudouridine(1915)-N(3))-methyltransferase RlmH [Hyphomicrobiales bacterium]
MVRLLTVGRMKAGPERELFERYWTRATPMAKQLGFGALDVVELRESQQGFADARKADEAAQLLAKVSDGAALIALDERGKAITTPQFSLKLETFKDAGKPVALIIGGPDGLDGSIRRRADLVISFGAMTMPHQLVRVLAAEQLYRAMTVLSGHPYHRV